MPKYVILANWTEQGIKGFRDSVHRTDEFSRLVEKAGGRVIDRLWTLGEYDVVVTLEMPDDEAVTALMLQQGAAGNVRTKTLRAFDAGEMAAIVERAG